MIRIILSAALLVAAGNAQAQLTWPTNCVPAHTGPQGQAVPEKCATIGPTITGELSSITIYDPETGYTAPDAVIAAAARQDDLVNTVQIAFGRWNAACEPDATAWQKANAFDPEQINDLAWLVATGTRDNGAHQTFTAATFTGVSARATELCGNAMRCKASVQYLAPIEITSVAAYYRAGRSISYATLAAMHEVAKLSPDLGSCPVE
jgi:hypothetical protein